jgi:hypothetical protein
MARFGLWRVVSESVTWVRCIDVGVSLFVVVDKEPIERHIGRQHGKVLVASVSDKVDSLSRWKGAIVDTGQMQDVLRAAIQMGSSLAGKGSQASCQGGYYWQGILLSLTLVLRSVCRPAHCRCGQEMNELISTHWCLDTHSRPSAMCTFLLR